MGICWGGGEDASGSTGKRRAEDGSQAKGRDETRYVTIETCREDRFPREKLGVAWLREGEQKSKTGTIGEEMGAREGEG